MVSMVSNWFIHSWNNLFNCEVKNMTDKLPESRVKANEKWNENNKERMRYLRSRSSAKSFINNRATIDDIEELRELLNARENNLRNDDK